MFVGFGGALGAIARFVISSKLSHSNQEFPWGTFTANLAGAFIIGLLYVALVDKPIFNAQLSESLRQLLIVGFLGALTTYSSFSLESINLFLNGSYMSALIYLLATTIACLTFTLIAIKVTRAFL